MLDTIIAERYATSLFELAQEASTLEKIKADMELLIELVSENKDLKHMLVSPIIRPEKKVGVLDALLSEKVDDLTQKFYHLLANKRREKYLVGIAKAFIEKYKAYNKIITIEIRTVSKMSEPMRKQVVELLEKRRDITVELIEVIDPSIIGGFIVSTGNLRYDSSLTTSIKKLKKEFEENLYIREF